MPQPRIPTPGSPPLQPLSGPFGTSKFRPRQDVFNSYFSEEELKKRPLSATILKQPHEVYALLRDIRNFPKFFENLEKVEEAGSNQANWYFSDPSNTPLKIPMTIAAEKAAELLIWKAEDAAGFDYVLAIALEPAQAGRGTIVRLKVGYESTAGRIVGLVEKLFGADAEMSAKKNLQRLKAFCETGHVPTTEGQPSGREELETKH